jgi:hypothetical protein
MGARALVQLWRAMAACRRLRVAVSKTGPVMRAARARNAAARADRPAVLATKGGSAVCVDGGAMRCANCAEVSRFGQGVVLSARRTRPLKSGGGVQPMVMAQTMTVAVARTSATPALL